MIYVGIDPGITGGIAYVSNKREEFVIPMPDFFELRNLLERWGDDTDLGVMYVYLEKAQSIRGNGGSAMFTYGHHNGLIEGLLRTLRIPYSLVPPKQWQKEMFVGTKSTDAPKQRALAAANRIFPKQNFLASLKCKKPHDGMIDSILIAEYCRRKII